MNAGPAFDINGRVFGQKVTGVQRYARNVIAAMDAALADTDSAVRVIAPPGTQDPGLAAIRFRTRGPLSGHAWEQAVLPLWSHGRLLNLCNTAPAIKRDQVVCIHDANVFIRPESYSRSFRALYRTLQPLLVRRSARIAAVSQASARQIARHLPIRVEDIAVLPNGHEHALEWNPRRSTLPAERPGVFERGFVLALGSHARHKNLKLLADIAPALDHGGLDVVIAGGGGDIFAAEDLSAAPNILQLGRVSDDDLACLMDRALCLAFPSWTEGFGLPIVEAMARGCPVISSDRASMPEVCGDAALLASPSEPREWVRHIQVLLQSPELRKDLICGGRERVRLFSWTETAAGYMELLDNPALTLPARKPSSPASRRVAVIIATRGRSDVVSATVRHLLRTQTLKPACVIVSCIEAKDAGDLVALDGVRVVVGPPGLAAQRNTGLAALPNGVEVVVFFDDDFVADPQWLAVAVTVFRDEADVVSFTGRVLVDDVKGPGLSFAEAVKIVGEAGPKCKWSWIEPFSPYGCNMAFRRSAIGDLRFDERLVLYGWLEDRDFGAALVKRGGRSVKGAEARGVHMGVKGGRMMGDRLGYSQVVNPIYMWRKGTMTLRQVADHILRNLASNMLRSVKPEPFIDRRGRLRGNLLGLADVFSGHIAPERALRIGPKRETRMAGRKITAGRSTAQGAALGGQDATTDGPIALLTAVIAVVSREKFKLAAWVLFCVVAAFLYARSLPTVYTSTATLLLEPREQVTSADREASARPLLDLNRADSELQVMRSERLLAQVFDSLNLKERAELKPKPPGLVSRIVGSIRGFLSAPGGAGATATMAGLSREEIERQVAFDSFTPRFSARRVGQSYVIEISYSSSDAELAAQVVNAAASAYLLQSVALKADAARSSAEFVQGRLDALSAQVKSATEAVKVGRLPATSTPDADARIIGAGLQPLSPSSPRIGLIVAFGGVLGLMSGLFFIALLSLLDRKIRSATQLSRETGLACLATIPERVGSAPLSGQDPDRIVALQPESAFTAAIRDLRASIALTSSECRGANPVIALTAWSAGTGCSIVCMNLARLIQMSGRPVAVMDADVQGGARTLTARYPGQGTSLALLLSGKADLEAIRYQDVDGVAFLPAVAPQDGPAGSYLDPASPSLDRVVGHARERGLVLLDLPPLSETGDARIFAKQADGVIIVVSEGETALDELGEAVGLLTGSGVHVIGAVLNRAQG